MDPGRQGSGQADTDELPPVPGERGPVVSERDCLQSRELVAAPRTAEADRHVVAREPAATARENGRSVDQARPVLLAVAGRRTPDAAAVRGGPAAAGGAVGPRGVATVPALVWASAPLGGGQRGVREAIGDRYSLRRERSQRTANRPSGVRNGVSLNPKQHVPVVQEEWSRSKRKCPARIHRQEEVTTSQVKLTRTWREHRHFGRTSHAEVQFLEAGHFAIKTDVVHISSGMKEFLSENAIGPRNGERRDPRCTLPYEFHGRYGERRLGRWIVTYKE